VRAGFVLVTLAACGWGLWSLVLRPTGLAGTVTSPVMFAAMGVCALPLAWREPRPRWDRHTLLLLVGNTLCDVINVMCFFTALRITTVAIAVLTHYAAPIIVALAAPRIDGVVARGARRAAIVALVGLVIVLEPWRTPAHDTDHTAWLGAALGLASAIGYAGNVFVVRRLATRVGNARALAYHSLLAAVLTAPLGACGFAAVRASDAALLAGGAAILGCGGGLAYIAGLRLIGSARAAVLAYAEPLVAVVVGAVVWDEPLRFGALLGGALLVGSGAFLARQAR
jgi:drug/metabolite transporter (DMT)-like permease